MNWPLRPVIINVIGPLLLVLSDWPVLWPRCAALWTYCMLLLLLQVLLVFLINFEHQIYDPLGLLALSLQVLVQSYTDDYERPVC